MQQRLGEHEEPPQGGQGRAAETGEDLGGAENPGRDQQASSHQGYQFRRQLVADDGGHGGNKHSRRDLDRWRDHRAGDRRRTTRAKRRRSG